MGTVGIVGEYKKLKVCQFFKLNGGNGVEVQVNMGVMCKNSYNLYLSKLAKNEF